MKYKGSCHCGRVAFEVEGTIESGLACNCSICHRKGSLLWFVPRDKLRLVTPESSLSTYTFNKHVDTRQSLRRPVALICRELKLGIRRHAP